MTWTRLSDTFATDPRMMRLTDAAHRLHVNALVWSNQQLTDGLVPAAALPMLMPRHPDPSLLVVELVRVKLWTELADEDGWQVDWTDQEPSDRVLERRAATAARVARHRERARSNGVTAPVSNGVTERVTNAVGNAPPVPSRPEGQGTGGAHDVATPPPVDDDAPRCVCGRTEAQCRARRRDHAFTAADPESLSVAQLDADDVHDGDGPADPDLADVVAELVDHVELTPHRGELRPMTKRASEWEPPAPDWMERLKTKAAASS